MYLFENSQISNNYVASSRLNSRVVISKGMQLLQFPELGDSNKDKSVMLRTPTFCKRQKKKKKNRKAVLFSTAPYFLSTSSTKCTDHGQYKGIYVLQLPAPTPIPPVIYLCLSGWYYWFLPPQNVSGPALAEVFESWYPMD